MAKDDPSLSDVRARREEIRKQMQRLKAEDERWENTERMLGSLLPRIEGNAQIQMEGHAVAATGTGSVYVKGMPAGAAIRDPERETVESLIEILLTQHERLWWTANEIQEAVSEIKGQDVPMSTISPTLSLMKGKGTIFRKKLQVAAMSRVHTDHEFFDRIESSIKEAQTKSGGSAEPPDQVAG